MKPSKLSLKQLVFEALQNAAVENEYSWIFTEDPEVVACDMIVYDANLEDNDPAELIPYIQEWQNAQR